jgi:uncharacterized protein YkwD
MRTAARRTFSFMCLTTLLGCALAPAAGCGSSSGGSGPAKFGEGIPKPVEATPEIAGLERAMHARLNRDRAKKGLGPLAFDPELAAVARAHAEDMRVNRFFAHESPQTGTLEDRLDRAGYLASVARENLGEGPDVDRTEDALLHSPKHYENIMARDVTHVGIGIVKGGVEAPENLLVTQVFAAPVASADPAQAVAAVAQKIQEARRAAGLGALKRDPKLDELARQHVGEVTDDLDPAASERIGDAVTGALAGSGLRGVLVATTVILSPAIFEPSGAVVGGSARAIGIAAAPAHDPRGRPAIKVLMLVGI